MSLLIVYNSFVILKLFRVIASKRIIVHIMAMSVAVSVEICAAASTCHPGAGTIRGRGLFHSTQASERMREQFEGGKYSRK